MIQRRGGETAVLEMHALYNVSRRKGIFPTEISRTDMQGVFSNGPSIQSYC